MVQQLNRPLLTAALLTGLTLTGLTIGAAAVAQNRDIGTPSPPAHDIGTPSPPARDQIATPQPDYLPDGAYVPGQESLSQCPLGNPESILDVARSYPNPQIRVMTPTEFFASEEARVFQHAPAFGCGDKRQSIYIIFRIPDNAAPQDEDNRFDLGAEQTATVTDAPNPPFDGNLGTPQLDLPPDLPGAGGGTTTATVFGGGARNAGAGTGGRNAGSRTPAQQAASPPPLCGQPAKELEEVRQAVERWRLNFEAGVIVSYEQAVGMFAPPVEDLLIVDSTKPHLPVSTAWRAPGVKTQSEGSQFGCLPAAIAQDLRWKTGKPFVALPRTLDLPGGVSLETAGSAGFRKDGDILRSIYGSPNQILRRYGYQERRYDQSVWISFVNKQGLDILISQDAQRGGHPRGVVGLDYHSSPIGHAVNVRWNGAGQVEYWDASTGAPADLTDVKGFWFFPTN